MKFSGAVYYILKFVELNFFDLCSIFDFMGFSFYMSEFSPRKPKTRVSVRSNYSGVPNFTHKLIVAKNRLISLSAINVILK